MPNLIRPSQKSLLKLVLIPLAVSSIGVSESFATSRTIQKIENTTQNIVIAQRNPGWIATLFQRRPTRRNGARNDVCTISPGLVDTYMVWNEKPLFLWRSIDKQAKELQETQLIVREYDSQKIIWQQPIQISQQKALYQGEESLKPGKLYQWLIVQKSRELTNPGLFKIMPTAEREKIKSDLETIEQQGKSIKTNSEEIVLKKVDYFLNYQIKHQTDKRSANLWSDALTLLYSVENPSYVQEREQLVQDICTSSNRRISK
jgi:hypothetical protein